jgi:hypothetical protein
MDGFHAGFSDKEFGSNKMISPVSSQLNAYVQQTQLAKAQPAPTAAQPSKTEDSVQISAQAKAALSGGDVDHDGDSH